MWYFIKALLIDVLWAFGLSGVFSIIRVIFHGNVTRVQFLAGAAGIFVFLLVDYVYNLIRTIILAKKDPVFREMTATMGISWRDYKRMKRY